MTDASRNNSASRSSSSPASGVDPTPIVELDGVVVDFQRRRSAFGATSRAVRAVDHVSLHIRPGETLGLVGESGSGKTTVGRVVAGMLPPTQGTVRLDGRTLGQDPDVLAAHRRNVQIVFQDPYSSLDPRMRVADIIGEPLRRRGLSRVPRAAAKDRVREMLDLVGLPPNADRMYPHQFSGGQRQRIALARGLSSNPRLVVLDEPTSALDVSIRAQILKLLKDIQSRLDVAYLIISHDLGSVGYLASRVAVMYRGRLVEEGSTDDIFESAQHPYTQLLLDSVPREDESFLDLGEQKEQYAWSLDDSYEDHGGSDGT